MIKNKATKTTVQVAVFVVVLFDHFKKVNPNMDTPHNFFTFYLFFITSVIIICFVASGGGDRGAFCNKAFTFTSAGP